MSVKSFEEYVEKFKSHMHFNKTFPANKAAELLAKLHKEQLTSLLGDHEIILMRFIEVYAERGFKIAEGGLDGKAAEKISIFGTAAAWGEGFVPEHHWSEQFMVEAMGETPVTE
jgi:hypothetical protein